MADRLKDLRDRCESAQEVLALDARRDRVRAAEASMEDPTFWQDQEKARRITQETSAMKRELATWDDIATRCKNAKELLDFLESTPDEAMLRELGAELEVLDVLLKQQEFTMLFSGEFDEKSAILSLHAGAGGTDANDWVAMLLRMYTRFAERQGWSVEVLEESPAEVTGYKSVSLRIVGRHAYGHLRSEHGVHRLVRISPFDAEQMRHTTFALCEVIPEFDDVDAADIVLDPEDLRIDTFMSSGKGGQSVNTTYSAVRITHLPTNIVVACQNERSQSQNKDIALRLLKAKLYRLMIEARAEKISDVKGEHKTAAWGNQLRSYVLHPYKMVKDHRTDEETSDTQGVLDGNLLPFIEAFLRKDAQRV